MAACCKVFFEGDTPFVSEVGHATADSKQNLFRRDVIIFENMITYVYSGTLLVWECPNEVQTRREEVREWCLKTFIYVL